MHFQPVNASPVGEEQQIVVRGGDEDVFDKILLARKAAKMLAIGRPRIAVCGLNPHAGEAGLFGEEEIREIAPAIRQAKKRGINAIGPAVNDWALSRPLVNPNTPDGRVTSGSTDSTSLIES